jgi:hypothetical protein
MPGRDLLGKKFGELAKLDQGRGRIVEDVACGSSGGTSLYSVPSGLSGVDPTGKPPMTSTVKATMVRFIQATISGGKKIYFNAARADRTAIRQAGCTIGFRAPFWCFARCAVWHKGAQESSRWSLAHRSY